MFIPRSKEFVSPTLPETNSRRAGHETIRTPDVAAEVIAKYVDRYGDKAPERMHEISEMIKYRQTQHFAAQGLSFRELETMVAARLECWRKAPFTKSYFSKIEETFLPNR
jgi:hypothetical protein